MKKQILTTVSILTVMALAAACAPAGSKTKKFTSGAPDEAGIAAGAGEKDSLVSAKSEDVETPAMRLIVKGKAAKAAFMALDVDSVDLMDADQKNVIGLKRVGADITCAQTGLVEEKATYSCEMPMYTDGAIGKKPSKAALKREADAKEAADKKAAEAAPAAAAAQPAAPAPAPAQASVSLHEELHASDK